MAAPAFVVASKRSSKSLAVFLFGLKRWHSWLCAQRLSSSTPSPISHTCTQTSPIIRSPLISIATVWDRQCNSTTKLSSLTDVLHIDMSRATLLQAAADDVAQPSAASKHHIKTALV
ncbi:hypothetical protein Q8A73_016408 [Channa argus]|nr:hypothetical protein Q8A73_016408 [Channa argus]